MGSDPVPVGEGTSPEQRLRPITEAERARLGVYRPVEAWTLALGRQLLLRPVRGRTGAVALVVVAALQWAGVVEPHEPTACEVAAAEWPGFVRCQ